MEVKNLEFICIVSQQVMTEEMFTASKSTTSITFFGSCNP